MICHVFIETHPLNIQSDVVKDNVKSVLITGSSTNNVNNNLKLTL